MTTKPLSRQAIEQRELRSIGLCVTCAKPSGGKSKCLKCSLVVRRRYIERGKISGAKEHKPRAPHDKKGFCYFRVGQTFTSKNGKRKWSILRIGTSIEHSMSVVCMLEATLRGGRLVKRVQTRSFDSFYLTAFKSKEGLPSKWNPLPE